MNGIALVGSLRQASFNMRLARWMQERYRGRWDIEVEPIGELPFFNQDQESQPPATVRAFKERIRRAQSVLIVTPEYNWSVPGVLKNAIDWLSRGDKGMIGKPVLVAGVSTGMMGTIRAQLHLREILASPGVGARPLPPGGNEILVTFAQDKFSDAGLTDEATIQFIDQVVDRFLAFAAQ
ncbi:NADPH-dependent FMN reductase [Alicyclobacillus sp.]|uniref:NADPH-dependent FMN reductase n=1 Tax=Alicyclobacillus sp. TaxID=61169 RepID=UPI0025B97DC4|nr:NADPH-dependent FMN reductase [Alicyclobacillus sp.]MCL6516070.1 NAD(P)H-dependent oxidoreductase [Alicyclobacillus sp.]